MPRFDGLDLTDYMERAGNLFSNPSATAPTTVAEQAILGPLLGAAFNAKFNPRYSVDPPPTLDEHRANCRTLGLIVCTCHAVENVDDERGRVLIVDPGCQVHRAR